MGFPLMFQAILDVLPMQASAVSCEHVFSSSKETCAMHQNLLSLSLFEVLQVFKHIYKQGCLDFMSDLITMEENHSIESVTEEVSKKFVVLRKMDKPLYLLHRMDELPSSTGVNSQVRVHIDLPNQIEPHQLVAIQVTVH
jgi:hypothetical protein